MVHPAPLVLLHPYPTDATFWDAMRPHLRAGRPVLTPEVPGAGAAPADPDWTITGMADEVARRIAGWAPHGRAVVMGVSMGGYVAQALVARHPERVCGLVLADTRAEADDDAALAARADAIARVEADGPAAYLADFLPRLLAPDADRGVRDALAAIAGRQTPASITSALRALAGRVDRRPDLPAVACPTLVLVGSEDAVTPPAAARLIAELVPGAQLHTLAGAGHMSPLERPAEVAALTEQFLASHGL